MKEDIEFLKVDIANKKQAHKNITEALHCLIDVCGLDEEYESLHDIAEEINDNIIDDENRLERMEEY